MIKVKDKYKDQFIGFSGSNGRNLGQLNQSDLETLAKIALSSNDKTILDVFDGPLPNLSDLKKAKLMQIAKNEETYNASNKEEGTGN